jgi:hypothetical protein
VYIMISRIPLSNSSNDGKRSAMFAVACKALCIEWAGGYR